MANKDRLAVLMQGVPIWNEWRRIHSETTPDLSDANLEDMYLENANFEGANLSGANLSRCLLRWARFNGAILNEVVLDEADITATVLEKIQKQQKLKKLKKQHQEETLDAHKQFLQLRNLQHQGIQPATGKSCRVTYCWNCKEHLDSSDEFECCACGWILCHCGACGCSYSK